MYKIKKRKKELKEFVSLFFHPIEFYSIYIYIFLKKFVLAYIRKRDENVTMILIYSSVNNLHGMFL